MTLMKEGIAPHTCNIVDKPILTNGQKQWLHRAFSNLNNWPKQIMGFQRQETVLRTMRVRPSP